jgi:ribonuclease HI
MTAIIRGLEQTKKFGIDEVRIFTDSNYTKNGITSWIKNWKRNGWRTASGTAVKNKELWKTLDTLVQSIKIVEWRWVKAHNGNVQNELVDKLARSTAYEFQNNLNVT